MSKRKIPIAIGTSSKKRRKPNLKSNATKKHSKKRSASTKKNSSRNSAKINRSVRKGKSTTKKHVQKRKPISKGKVSIRNRKTKTPLQSRHSKKVVKTVSRRVEKSKPKSGRLYSEPQKRGSKQIDFVFKDVRSVNKKITLIKEQAGDAIKKQLAKRGGKPPRGIIVTVRDKRGREKTELSPLTFVVNKDNVQNFVNDMLARMKDNFMEWKDMEESGDDMTDADPYGNYNPDNIAEITIKFII